MLGCQCCQGGPWGQGVSGRRREGAAGLQRANIITCAEQPGSAVGKDGVWFGQLPSTGGQAPEAKHPASLENGVRYCRAGVYLVDVDALGLGGPLPEALLGGGGEEERPAGLQQR